MTLPHERTRAVLETRRFLIALGDPKSMRRIPRHIRRQALALLKHYPSNYDMQGASFGAPAVFSTITEAINSGAG